MPIFFGLILIFIIWLHYEKRKTSKAQVMEKSEFIKREQNANLSRKKDISKLDYITLSTSNLPLEKSNDDITNHFIETYLTYIDKKIVNLSHLSNTEIKEQYGLANLALLSEYDENFYSLVKLLDDWGLHLLSTDHLNDAAKVLELAVSIKTDITQSYLSLATVYQKQQCPEKIATLKTAFLALSESPNPSVLEQLDKAALYSLLEPEQGEDLTINLP